MYTDKEYLILEHINDNSVQTRQRDLAAAADLSLGMTNAVLKKLVSKGFLVMKRVNSRNIHYAITPEGLKHIARRSRELLKRTLSNVAWYRDATERYVKELKARGVTEITLQGPSDLDFILEWACMKNALIYNQNTVNEQAKVKELNEQELFSELESRISAYKGK
jgi:DNA-binding MarR family transcriptional regulator